MQSKPKRNDLNRASAINRLRDKERHEPRPSRTKCKTLRTHRTGR